MKTALIIEDNENNMELMRFILEAHGYRVVKAYTGRLGVELARSLKPDFILLDIQLPDILGTEVLAEIRRSEAREARVPVIAVTSFAMAGDEERLLAAGCNGYVEKPIQPERIMDQIERILEEAK
ncbi:MAG TPA: response regulator [Kiritimatiellia bacterium]|nr:response regulator [Kiritimatiellia bacterium]